jgi:hypothetical protein
MEHLKDIGGVGRGTSFVVRRGGVPVEPRSTLFGCWGVCEGQLPDSWPVALPADRGTRSGGVALPTYYPEPAPWHYFECPGCLIGGKPAWYHYSCCPDFDGAPYAKRLCPGCAATQEKTALVMGGGVLPGEKKQAGAVCNEDRRCPETGHMHEACGRHFLGRKRLDEHVLQQWHKQCPRNNKKLGLCCSHFAWKCVYCDSAFIAEHRLITHINSSCTVVKKRKYESIK